MMVDKGKEGMAISASGIDWEVVSVTASVYAAAPGRDGIGLSDNKKDKEFDENNEETSHAVVTSHHFASPTKDETLLPETESLVESRVQNVGPIQVETDLIESKQEENWNYETLAHVDLHSVQLFDKGKRLFIHDVEFEEQATLQGLNLVKEGQHMHGVPVSSSFRSEKDIDGSISCYESKGISEPDDHTNDNLERSKCNGSGFPCEAWWKTRAVSLYTHAKGSTTFWSLCVAAAVMGLVIAGRRWHQERLQLQRSTSWFSFNDERRSALVGAVSRFKSVLIGSHHRIPVIHVDASMGN